ncbi:MAG: SDR family NAD(P)-dependent oxidoreductase [Clostridiales bacterium]|nr:SDR family NAD(P)-dependent oxidoreductase [Clostridiales bacterium]
MFSLYGRVAVLTGASSGLGLQLARGFAAQGADLAILARRFERLEAIAADFLATTRRPISPDRTSRSTAGMRPCDPADVTPGSCNEYFLWFVLIYKESFAKSRNLRRRSR